MIGWWRRLLWLDDGDVSFDWMMETSPLIKWWRHLLCTKPSIFLNQMFIVIAHWNKSLCTDTSVYTLTHYPDSWAKLSILNSWRRNSKYPCYIIWFDLDKWVNTLSLERFDLDKWVNTLSLERFDLTSEWTHYL